LRSGLVPRRHSVPAPRSRSGCSTTSTPNCSPGSCISERSRRCYSQRRCRVGLLPRCDPRRDRVRTCDRIAGRFQPLTAGSSATAPDGRWRRSGAGNRL